MFDFSLPYRNCLRQFLWKVTPAFLLLCGYLSFSEDASPSHVSPTKPPRTKPNLSYARHWNLAANCNLLGYCAARSDNSLPTFRDNLSIPFSRVKNSRRKPEISHFCGKATLRRIQRFEKILGFLNTDHGTNTMSRYVGKDTSTRCAMAQKRAVLMMFFV